MQIHIPLECVIEHLIFQETKPGIHKKVHLRLFPARFKSIILQIPLESLWFSLNQVVGLRIFGGMDRSHLALQSGGKLWKSHVPSNVGTMVQPRIVS